jgi:hypothetical protein
MPLASSVDAVPDEGYQVAEGKQPSVEPQRRAGGELLTTGAGWHLSGVIVPKVPHESHVVGTTPYDEGRAGRFGFSSTQ